MTGPDAGAAEAGPGNAATGDAGVDAADPDNAAPSDAGADAADPDNAATRDAGVDHAGADHAPADNADADTADPDTAGMDAPGASDAAAPDPATSHPRATASPPAAPPALPARAFVPAAPQPRADGWTPERQADFIEALADSGSITRAAKAVGMSRESAYRLRRRADAADFAAAWDDALAVAVRTLADACLDRAIHGVEVPILYKGEVVATRTHHSDQLAMFILRHRDPLTYGSLSGPREYDASMFDPVRQAVARLPALVSRLPALVSRLLGRPARLPRAGKFTVNRLR